MVTPINHVIAGPDLHRRGPLALRGFLQNLSDNIEKIKQKSYDFRAGPPTGIAPYYGKFGPG